MTVSDLEKKACAEALQATQKRTRTAFFLSIGASCIVLLMVFNLWESHQLRQTNLIRSTGDQSDYVKQITSHIADSSYYQIPTLGIQVACDDVGLFGPLALFVFSLYSAMAFKALRTHVQCASREPFSDSPLITTLLETEQPPPSLEKLSAVFRALVFVPFLACLAVAGYAIYAHIPRPPQTDPLYEILTTVRATGLVLDLAGIVFTILVFICNRQSYRDSKTTKDEAAKCLYRHRTFHDAATATAGV